jgi:Flp pilus assembly pilin Flp
VEKVKKNKSGQAVVEYLLILVLVVSVVVWGFGYIKCSLHGIWVKMACDVLYPYPYSQVKEKEDYCEPKGKCFEL